VQHEFSIEGCRVRRVFGARCLFGVPKMATSSRSKRLLARLIEATASQAQGRRREAGSEHSVERNCALINNN